MPMGSAQVELISCQLNVVFVDCAVNCYCVTGWKCVTSSQREEPSVMYVLVA